MLYNNYIEKIYRNIPKTGGNGMKKIIARLVSLVAALTAAAAVSLSAFAGDYTYSFDDSSLIPEIIADTYDISGTEMSLEKELADGETDAGMSVRCSLFNEYIDSEFWSNPDVKVSIEVKLETEGANVIGYIIGFDSKWTWINPSDFTVLKYNEWITITETGAHFYEYFKVNRPSLLLFQTRSNWGAGAQGSVKVSIRNFTISDGTSTVVIPTQDAPAPETPESDPVTTSGTDSSTTPAPDNAPETTPAPATTIQTASMAQSSIDYNDINLIESKTEKSTAMVFIIIIVIAVVVVAGIVIGYLIYKKKKYY